MESTKCKVMIVAEDSPPIVEELIAADVCRMVMIPEQSYFFHTTQNPTPSYPYDAAFEEVRSQPLAVFHTSGSTGIPKPVYVAHGSFTSQDAFHLIPEIGGTPTWWSFIAGKRWLMGFPFYHFASYVYLSIAAFGGMETVLGPAKKVLNLDSIASICVHGKIEGAVLTPSLIIDLVKDESYCEKLCQLEFLLYTGGSLPRDIGDRISRKLRLFTVVGTTENAGFPVEVKDDNDWDYLKFSPYLGCRFDQYDHDRWELIHVRDPALQLYQGVFSTFPDLDELPTKDLYSKHPTKEGYWKHRGRADDIITFLTAEKLNPVDMEATISTHPEVETAFIVGQSKFHTAVLIEPKCAPVSPEEKAQLLDRLWPAIGKANEDCPAFARVLPAFVLFTTPSKPMVRTEKGTFIRYKTVKAYEAEINQLYETNTIVPERQSAEAMLESSVKEMLFDAVQSILLGRNIQQHDDLFEHGMDSLGIMMLAKNINAYVIALKTKAQPIPITMIYRNPTIALLEYAVEQYIASGHAVITAQEMEPAGQKAAQAEATKVPTLTATQKDVVEPVR
ncbi:MAG: putative NRPS-like protein biosynthetic cluster [Chrysothrix sp. TS-e1954]|nr:MAG: putative NRPS-like protein biosynthetic cluster [Chrysothrix sp. TS-e1954]